MADLAQPCPKCFDMKYIVRRGEEAAEAVVCTCSETCSKCGGTGYVLERDGVYEVAAPCECLLLRKRVRLFNDARIPADYGHKTIERWDRGGNPAKDRLWRKLLHYQKGFDIKRSRGLLLHGEPGTGKTHLLCGLVRYLTLERGIACRFIDFFDLTRQIRDTYNDHSGLNESDIIDPLVQVPVLALDELGKGRASDYERTIVDQLISRRYNTGRIVLATTNYPPNTSEGGIEVAGASRIGGAAAAIPLLEERVGARVYSRLVEMCDFEIAVGPDYRKTARTG